MTIKTSATAWAIKTDFPEPGAVEYLRPVGRVTCGDSHEEVVVCLVQRDEGPVQVSMAGMRLAADEAELLFRVVRNAVLLIPGAASEPEDVGAQLS